ncbi:MAG: YaaA family protein [Desulfobacterales bacterium]|nr:YaaA family protein [Desulfobacterales bacterium]
MILTLLSPSKTMEMDHPDWAKPHAELAFKEKTLKLLGLMKALDTEEIRKWMKVSSALAETTRSRFAAFSLKKTGCPALFAYRGDAFQSLGADTLSFQDIHWAEDRLFILSGLYGLLSPLHGIFPYRLEMGLTLEETGPLSSWWRDAISENLMDQMTPYTTILNLASAEYTRAIDKKRFGQKWMEVHFKERDGEKMRSVAIHAKRARGAMARFIIQNRIERLDEIKMFQKNGYQFDKHGSDDRTLLFTR